MTRKRRPLTLREAFDRMCKDRAPGWSQSTLRQYQKRFVWLSPLADEELEALTPERLVPVLEHVRSNAKASISEGAKGEGATKAVAYLLNAIIQHALKAQLIERDPLDGLSVKGRFQGKAFERGRVLLKTELARLWAWLHAHATPAARDFILLQLLAGLPRATIAQLAVKQIDTAHWLLRVPAIESRVRTEREINHPVPRYIVDRVLKPRLATLRPGQVYLIEDAPNKPMLSVRGALSNRSLKERTGLAIAEKDVWRTAAVVMLAASFHNKAMARRLLTVKSQIVSMDDPSLEQLREAQERAVAEVLKICEPKFAAPKTKGTARK